MDDPRIPIDARDIGHEDRGILLVLENAADRPSDIRRRQGGCCNLIEQGLEGVEIVAVDHRHIDRRPRQGLSQCQPAEARPDDHDSWCIGHLTLWLLPRPETFSEGLPGIESGAASPMFPRLECSVRVRVFPHSYQLENRMLDSPKHMRGGGLYSWPRSRRRRSTSCLISASRISLGTAFDGRLLMARTRSGSNFGSRFDGEKAVRLLLGVGQLRVAEAGKRGGIRGAHRQAPRIAPATPRHPRTGRSRTNPRMRCGTKPSPPNSLMTMGSSPSSRPSPSNGW